MRGLAQQYSRQLGFTLVEMTVAIMLIAILAVGSTRFIGQSAQGYINQVERQQVSTIAWIISEQVTKSIRSALPNSVRVNASGSCIELIPTVAGTDYLSVPIGSDASSFEVVPFSDYGDADISSDHRVAVYPSSISGLYGLADPGTISGVMDSLGTGVTSNSQLLTLSSSHEFLTDSPMRRLFVVSDPEMYCFSGDYLYRYRSYGFNASMPSSPGASPVVIASDIESGEFNYSAGGLGRNGLVTMNFNIEGDDGTVHPVTQEVHTRNVP